MKTKKNDLQVTRDHYFTNYDSLGRWMSYWIQIESIKELNSQKILEIGPGSGLVTHYLKKQNLQIKTLDIDPDLNPDIISSVLALPFKDNSFDTVLCCQVLEHISFSDFKKALQEIFRITKKYFILSLPYPSISFGLILKIYRIGIKSAVFRLRWPKKMTEKPQGGQHYWEIGKRNYGIRKIRKILKRQGFQIIKEKNPAIHPYHQFFILEKISKNN